MTVFGSRGVPIRLWAKHTTQLVPAALLGVGPATLGIVEVDVTTGERLHGGRPTAVVNFTVAPPAEAQTLLANRFHMHAASPSLQSLAADNAALEVCHPWVPPLPDAWSDVQLFTSVQLEGREVQFTVGRHEAAAQVRAHFPYTAPLCTYVHGGTAACGVGLTATWACVLRHLQAARRVLRDIIVPQSSQSVSAEALDATAEWLVRAVLRVAARLLVVSG